MKQPKKVSRRLKPICLENGINPKDWMVLAENNQHVSLLNKATKEKRTISKY